MPLLTCAVLVLVCGPVPAAFVSVAVPPASVVASPLHLVVVAVADATPTTRNRNHRGYDVVVHSVGVVYVVAVDVFVVADVVVVAAAMLVVVVCVVAAACCRGAYQCVKYRWRGGCSSDPPQEPRRSRTAKKKPESPIEERRSKTKKIPQSPVDE